jgi:FlaG/FlaF family flagellin (archaellin)
MREELLPRDWRGVSKVVGVVLLVAVVLLLATIVAVGVTNYSDELSTLDAGAAFSLSQHPAGIQMNVESIGTNVTIRVNGDPLSKLDTGDAGTSLVLPIAPGDRVVATSGSDS